MIWLLAAKNVKEIWRDKKILIVSLFFPAFLLLTTHLFYAHSKALFDGIPIDVVNSEKSSIGKLLVYALQNTKLPHSEKRFFHLSEVSKERALSDLKKGSAAGALFIPAKLAQSIDRNQSRKLLLLLNSSDKRAGILAPALSSLIEHFDFLIAKSRGGPSEPLSISYFPINNEISGELESFLNVFIFALIFLISYAAGGWISEFEHGSFRRFQLSRFPERAMLGGTFLATLFLGLVQTSLLLLFAKTIGINVDELFLAIWPFAFLLILASSGAGFILAAVLDKEKQLNLYASLVLIPLYLLSSSLAADLQFHKLPGYLPWHQGFLLLSAIVNHEPMPGLLLIRMIFSSLILAFFGLGIFSLRRLRHGS